MVSDQRLMTPLISLPDEYPDYLTFKFQHWYLLEPSSIAGQCYDGALLEISTDSGTTWTQLQDDVLQTNPYDGTVSDQWSNPLGGLNAWCGDSPGWIESVVDLSAYAGQTVQFRYRLGTDISNIFPVEGWYVDDVAVQSCISTRYIYLPLVMR